MIPAVAPLVKVKSPSIVDAATINAVVPPSMITSASAPALSLVVIVTAPVKALVVIVLKSMVASCAVVTRVEVPPTVSAPVLCVMLPVVAVALRFPPIPEAIKFRAVALTTVALPLPWVVRSNEPLTARLPRSMTPSLSSVVAIRLPLTFSVPVSIMA